MSDSETDLHSHFVKAAEIAKLVPQHLQEAAFNRALDVLLRKELAPASDRASKVAAGRAGQPPKARQEVSVHGPKADVTQTLCEQLDRTAHPEISADRNALDNALLLLRAARDDCAIEWLGPSQIAAVLKTKFLVRVDRTTLSKTLGEAGRLVDRKSAGLGFAYRLMGAGEKHLAKSGAPTPQGGAPVATRKGTKRRAGRSATPAPSDIESGKTIRPRSSAGRPGPKAMLESLIGQGYFSSPRTIRDIADHISKHRAHTYKPTDLSPTLVRLLREGSLQREHNDDGQFVYKQP